MMTASTRYRGLPAINPHHPPDISKLHPPRAMSTGRARGLLGAPGLVLAEHVQDGRRHGGRIDAELGRDLALEGAREHVPGGRPLQPAAAALEGDRPQGGAVHARLRAAADRARAQTAGKAGGGRDVEAPGLVDLDSLEGTASCMNVHAKRLPVPTETGRMFVRIRARVRTRGGRSGHSREPTAFHPLHPTAASAGSGYSSSTRAADTAPGASRASAAVGRGCRRFHVGLPGFTSSRGPSCTTLGIWEWPYTTSSARGNQRASRAGRPREGPASCTIATSTPPTCVS